MFISRHRGAQELGCGNLAIVVRVAREAELGQELGVAERTDLEVEVRRHPAAASHWIGHGLVGADGDRTVEASAQRAAVVPVRAGHVVERILLDVPEVDDGTRQELARPVSQRQPERDHGPGLTGRREVCLLGRARDVVRTLTGRRGDLARCRGADAGVSPVLHGGGEHGGRLGEWTGWAAGREVPGVGGEGPRGVSRAIDVGRGSAGCREQRGGTFQDDSTCLGALIRRAHRHPSSSQVKVSDVP